MIERNFLEQVGTVFFWHDVERDPSTIIDHDQRSIKVVFFLKNIIYYFPVRVYSNVLDNSYERLLF